MLAAHCCQQGGLQGNNPWGRVEVTQGQLKQVRSDSFLRCLHNYSWRGFHWLNSKGPLSLIMKVLLLFLHLFGGPDGRPPLFHYDSHEVAHLALKPSPQVEEGN